jgi:hypothetical protein
MVGLITSGVYQQGVSLVILVRWYKGNRKVSRFGSQFTELFLEGTAMKNQLRRVKLARHLTGRDNMKLI